MKGRTRVKICGITSQEDVDAAVAAGADALGFVFYEPSPRNIDVEKARNIATRLGPFVTLVGLFVDASAETINNVLKRVPLHVLQFHGKEDAQFCEQFGRAYMKALRMKPGLDVVQAMAAYPSAAGILLDAYRKGVPGGTGETFDWGRVPQRSSSPIILAGGLTPENVVTAVTQTQPYGVDVSGGVEASPGMGVEASPGKGVKTSPGKKDFEKVVAFIKNAKTGD